MSQAKIFKRGDMSTILTVAYITRMPSPEMWGSKDRKMRVLTNAGLFIKPQDRIPGLDELGIGDFFNTTIYGTDADEIIKSCKHGSKVFYVGKWNPKKKTMWTMSIVPLETKKETDIRRKRNEELKVGSRGNN